LDLGRWDVVRTGDKSHGNWVARTRLDLFSVGDRRIWRRQAEVDKVVHRYQRCDLAYKIGGCWKYK
jgi:hypothetical protein